MTLSAHEVTRRLYMAHRYDDGRGNFCSSRRMTKDHVVCGRTLKIPPDIYIYVSELHSMIPTEIATSSLNSF